jgi:hypothetical protein
MCVCGGMGFEFKASHLQSPFCSVCFGDGRSNELFAWAAFKSQILLISTSQVDRFTGMSHQHLDYLVFFFFECCGNPCTL